MLKEQAKSWSSRWNVPPADLMSLLQEHHCIIWMCSASLWIMGWHHLLCFHKGWSGYSKKQWRNFLSILKNSNSSYCADPVTSCFHIWTNHKTSGAMSSGRTGPKRISTNTCRLNSATTVSNDPKQQVYMAEGAAAAQSSDLSLTRMCWTIIQTIILNKNMLKRKQRINECLTAGAAFQFHIWH